jgi:hypothetical protein
MPTQAPSFADILKRFSAPQPRGVKTRGPIVASVAPLDSRFHRQQSESWAILHAVTDLGLKLIHPRPLNAEHVAVSLVAPAGEILQAILARGTTEPMGDLYETTAEFLKVPLESLVSRGPPERHRPPKRHPRAPSHQTPIERDLDLPRSRDDCGDVDDDTLWAQGETDSTGFG